MNSQFQREQLIPARTATPSETSQFKQESQFKRESWIVDDKPVQTHLLTWNAGNQFQRESWKKNERQSKRDC
jgi:hypothetical protein